MSLWPAFPLLHTTQPASMHPTGDWDTLPEKCGEHQLLPVSAAHNRWRVRIYFAGKLRFVGECGLRVLFSDSRQAPPQPLNCGALAQVKTVNLSCWQLLPAPGLTFGHPCLPTASFRPCRSLRGRHCRSKALRQGGTPLQAVWPDLGLPHSLCTQHSQLTLAPDMVPAFLPLQAAVYLYGANAITNFGLEACLADTTTPVRSGWAGPSARQ